MGAKPEKTSAGSTVGSLSHSGSEKRGAGKQIKAGFQTQKMPWAIEPASKTLSKFYLAPYSLGPL